MLFLQLPNLNLTTKAEGVPGGIDLKSTTGWTRVYPANGQNDPQGDQQTGGSSNSVSQDIVGNDTYPSAFMKFSDDKTELAVRVRVNNCDRDSETPKFKNFVFAGIDANGNGTVDFFIGVYNPTGSNGRLGIYNADTSALNAGPSSTGISVKPLMAFAPVRDVNYSFMKAGSTIFGDDDYFITYKFKVSDISNAIQGKTREGVTFTADTLFRFITGTAAQDNAFNQDISGMDKTGWKSGKTWLELNVFSPVTSVKGPTYYAVTFDNNYGDTDASPAVKIIQGGSAIGELPTTNPTKRGMYFQGWNTKQDGTGAFVTASTVVNADTTVYAIWSNKDIYKVTFNPNNGNWGGVSTPKTVSTINGVIGANMPVDPTKAGDYFIGWGSDTTNNAKIYGSQTPITGTTTLYALWSSKAAYTVTFHDNIGADGGNVISSLYPNPSGQIQGTSLPSPTRSGFTFGGWYDNIGCSGTAFTGGKVTQNMDYYAKWTPATYTIMYNPNGGTLSGSPTVTAAEGKFVMPEPPTQAGKIFMEWNRSADGSGEPMYPSSDITANTTVFAIWKPSVKVTLDANGGTFDEGAPTVIDVKSNRLTELPIPPYRSDYTFLGWSAAQDSKTLVNLTGDFNTSTTLYGVWIPIYSVTFDANSGKWSGDVSRANVPTAYGSVLYYPEEPILDGYAFLGWNTAKDGKGTAFTTNTDVTENMVVYAVWRSTAVSHTVTFNTDGGSAVPDASVPNGGLVTMPEATEKTGYSFGGWYKNEECTIPWNFGEDTVTGNTTIYAKWNINRYTVAFDSKGGTTFGNQTINHGGLVLEPISPMQTGYGFGGWYKDENCTIPWNFGSDKVTANITLYAKWDINKYSVNFNSKGGSTVGVQTINYGGLVLEPAEPIQTGYSFKGWYKDENYTTPWNFGSDKVTANTTLYAKWTINSYTVTFNSKGGTTVGGQTINYGGLVLEPAQPIQTGYSFKGWYMDENYTTPWNFGVDKVTGNTTLYAKWDINKYSVTFDSKGGSTVGNQIINHGGLVLEPVSPIQTGHSFGGWYKDENYTTPWNFGEDRVTANTTLFAKWTINSYTVNFNSKGGSMVGNQTINHGSVVLEPAAPIQSGYGFAGWYKEESYTTPWDFSTDRVTVSTTLYAKWDINSYTVTFDSKGGSIVGSQTINHGGKVLEPVAPLQSGYGFGGWYKDENYTTPCNFGVDTVTANTILFAKWNANSYMVRGTVKDDSEDELPVPEVKVTVERSGNKVSGPVYTDEDGKFTLYNVPVGVYNLVIEYTDTEGITTIITQIIVVTGDTHVGTIKLPIGRKNSIFIPKADVSVNAVGKLNEVFDNVGNNTDEDLGVTANDLAVVENGGEVIVRLESDAVNESTQAKEISDVKTEINNNNKHLGYLVDLSVYKDVTPLNGQIKTSRLRELNNLVDIYITIPSEIQGKTGYAVYRHHDGLVNVITETPNENGEKIEINGSTLILTVQKFSVYAIAYDLQKGAVIVEDEKPGTVTLPTTGSAVDSTTLIIAGLLISAAGVILVTRKKHN